VNELATVNRMWDALGDRDWSRLAGFFGPESIYYDVPLGPSAAAKGPDGIVARLRLGIEPLADYQHHHGAVASGPDGLVVLEHAETWTWDADNTATLPIASVHRVVGGVITLWRDYWDYPTLMNAAPAWWVEHTTSGDLSWLYDASGQV
jgi:limonene-1,2-epoxide hydrolase